MNNNLPEYKSILLDIINNYLPNAKVYLFGSRARKTSLEGADIDIALDIGTTIDPKIILSITHQIDESKLPVFVDVVDLYSVSADMKQQILKDKVLWKN